MNTEEKKANDELVASLRQKITELKLKLTFVGNAYHSAAEDREKILEWATRREPWVLEEITALLWKDGRPRCPNCKKAEELLRVLLMGYDPIPDHTTYPTLEEMNNVLALVRGKVKPDDQSPAGAD